MEILLLSLRQEAEIAHFLPYILIVIKVRVREMFFAQKNLTLE